mgnify:CR=1 FL=1
MKRARKVLFLGIWVALLPYLGFPLLIKNILSSLSGLLVVYFSYVLYTEAKQKEKRPTIDTFAENHNFIDKETNI